MAIVCNETDEVMLTLQIEHHGDRIRDNLKTRSDCRRNRHSRETWYRKPKWGSKTRKKTSKFKADSPRPDGWLPPSVQSVADNIIHWALRLKRLIHITECSFEANRFDTQLMDDPAISGTQYQQGTLFEREVKEKLLDDCQYCHGKSGDTVLEVEHIHPRAKGGSDKYDNLTLACSSCNKDKGAKMPQDWLVEEKKIEADKKTSRKRRDLAKARVNDIGNVLAGNRTGKSNRYCAWANNLRRAAQKKLVAIFEDGHVECASGGRTKHNRKTLGLPKDHHWDALCVGTVPSGGYGGYKDRTNKYCLHIKAMGRGSRLRGQINSCGVIVVKFKDRRKRRFDFQNGDIVAADVPTGKYQGHHVGRVMTRANGYFDIRCTDGKLVTVNHKYCRILQHDNGYQYSVAKCK